MTTFVRSVSSHLCQASTCFRIGSKFRCMRSTPTEMQSMRENDFEGLANTGVKSPANAVFKAHEQAIPTGHFQKGRHEPFLVADSNGSPLSANPPSISFAPSQAAGNLTTHPRVSLRFSGTRTVQTRTSDPLFPDPKAIFGICLSTNTNF